MAVKSESHYTVYTWRNSSMEIPFRKGNIVIKRGMKFGLRKSGAVGLSKKADLSAIKVRMVILEPGFGPTLVHTPSHLQLCQLLACSNRQRDQ